MSKPHVYIDSVRLIGKENIFTTSLCCCFFACLTDYKEVIQYLHLEELNYFNTLKFEKRIQSYLLGRFVAKQAVATLTGEVNLTNILVRSGVFNQPIVVFNKQNIQVSISHCGHCGVAIAFSEAYPMGIDLEQISSDNYEVLAKMMTQNEKELVNDMALSQTTGLTLLWTAKEALAKILKTGLTTPLEVFEIKKIELHNNYFIGHYKNFAQYQVISFIVDSYVCSIAYPLSTEIRFDIASFNELLRIYSALECK